MGSVDIFNKSRFIAKYHFLPILNGNLHEKLMVIFGSKSFHYQVRISALRLVSGLDGGHAALQDQVIANERPGVAFGTRANGA